ncbi:MAG: hypothetical protein SynsKO_35650 [Synoicihabitans sp.]
MKHVDINIVFISDLHWSESLGGKKILNDHAKGFVKETNKYIKRVLLSQSNSYNVLCLGGDLINAGISERKNYEQIEQSLIGEIIDPISSSIKWDAKLAVPGNHDIQRAAEKNKNGESRYQNFIKLFQRLEGWRTPFDSTASVFHVPSEKILGKSVSFLLVNTSRNSESSATQWNVREILDKIELERKQIHSNPIEVGDEQYRNLSQQLDSGDQGLRIALMHHSPLPHPNEKIGEEEKNTFKDSGQYLKFMVKNQVQLGLAGHMHSDDVAFYSRPLDGAESKSLSPYFQSGSLLITTKAFLPFVEGEAPGFKVIRIRMFANSDVADLRITDVSKSEGSAKEGEIRRLLLPTKKLSGSSLEVWADFLKRLYGGEKKIEELRRLLDRKLYSKKQINTLRDFIHRAGDFRAGYAVNIIPADVWWRTDAQYLLPAVAQNSLTDAAVTAHLAKKDYFEKLSKRIDEVDENLCQLPHDIDNIPTLYYTFSRSLCTGIGFAKYASRSIKVSTLVADYLGGGALEISDEIRYLKSLVAGPGGKPLSSTHDSLSIWDNKKRKTELREVPYGSSQTIGIKNHKFDPRSHFGDEVNRKNISRLNESCRVLIWPLDEFDGEAAFRIVRLHEMMKVPLLWLDPDYLLSKNGNKRKEVGHFTILPAGAETHSRSNLTNVYGEHPREDELYCAPWGDRVNNLGDCLWGGDLEVPDSLPSEGCDALSEFQALVVRPDIMFAVDVWALCQLQRKNVVREYLEFRKPVVECKWLMRQ